MKLSHLRPVFETEGPFATVYLRTDRATATGAQEVDLRLRHAREGLVAAGAPEAAAAGIAAAVSEDVESPATERVVVWAGGRVVFDAALPELGHDEAATWGPLPRLLPYVRAYAGTVPHVVAVVDRTGGDLTAIDARGQVREVDTVEGVTTLHLRKVKVGDWAHLRYLHHVEEHWKANAKEIAAAVDRLVEEVAAERLVVAGDVRAREKLHGELNPRSVSVLTEIDHGGRADGVDQEAFDAAVREELALRTRHNLEERCAMFVERLAKGGAATEGVDGVVRAAREGRLDTLLIGEDFDEDARIWIGPQPLQLARSKKDLEPLGVSAPRADAVGSALVRAAAGSNAEALAVPADLLRPKGGIAALVRY